MGDKKNKDYKTNINVIIYILNQDLQKLHQSLLIIFYNKINIIQIKIKNNLVKMTISINKQKLRFKFKIVIYNYFVYKIHQLLLKIRKI